MPETDRENLLGYTRGWYRSLGDHIVQVSPETGLPALAELCWRMDKCGQALTNTFSKKWEKWLENVYYEDLSPELQEAYRFVAFALVARAREDGEEDCYAFWEAWLTQHVRSDTEEHARLSHQKVLRSLGTQDLVAVNKALADWPDLPGAHFLNTRKAGHYAEIGQVDNAKTLAYEAYKNFKLARRAEPNSLKQKTEEAWTAILIRKLESPYWSSEKPPTIPYQYWISVHLEKQARRRKMRRRATVVMPLRARRLYAPAAWTSRIRRLSAR